MEERISSQGNVKRWPYTPTVFIEVHTVYAFTVSVELAQPPVEARPADPSQNKGAVSGAGVGLLTDRTHSTHT